MVPHRAALTLRPLAEAMEERILHSADVGALLLGQAVNDSRVVDTAAVDAQRSEIAFVDASVPDAAALLADLQAQRAAGRPIEIVTIEAGQDGVALISTTLAGRSDITAVHVLAHGSDGALQLGNTTLDAQTLLQRASEVAGWSVALSADADLLLYGCDVAQSSLGRSFVQDLAALTGADVAASTDLTGAVAQGGNWALEYGIGRIDTALAINAAAQNAWTGTLAVTQSGVNSAASDGAVSNLSFAHSINAGSDRLLVVGVVIGNGSSSTSVTYNGTPLTLLAVEYAQANEVAVELWYLVAPPVGSGTVDINIDTTWGPQKVVAGAATFYGVDQATPFGVPVKNKGADGSPSLTVASAPGDLVIDVAGARNVSSASVGAGQTELFSQKNGSSSSDVWAVSSTEPGAASVIMSESFSGSADRWASIAVAVKQVNAVQIIAERDTYIRTGSANNYGDATNLVVDRSGGSALGDGRALLQFDLSSIPAGATITSATLQMQATTNGGGFNINVHALTEAWVEGSGGVDAANWTERTPGNNWNSAGGTFDPTPAATLNAGAVGQHSWNLTSLVQAWVTGGTANNGIIIGSPDTGTTTITYDSSEGATPPRLVVTYTLANAAPIITSNGGGANAAIAVPENTAAVTTVTATDPDPGTLTYSIIGGTDAARFDIETSSGVLRFVVPPNFEAPVDVGANNVYDVTVQVSDGSLTASQAIAVTVTNVNEALSTTGERGVNTVILGAQETSASDRGSPHAVAMSPAGNYVVVWSSQGQDGSGWGVYGQRYDNSGAKVGGEIAINQFTAGDQVWATVAMDAGGRFVVSWTSANQDGTPQSVYARRYAADGTASGGEFRVNTTVTGSQYNSSVAMDANGNFIVVWQGNGPGDSDGIFGRRYYADGTPIDAAEFRINTDLARGHYDASVSMNASGAFAVMWDNSAGVQLRRYDSSGVAQGGEINVDFGLSAGNGSVALADNGNLVVVWRETVFDKGIYLQRYNAAGAPIGTKALVNTTAAFDQTDPSIAVDGSGNFIVAWEGYGPGDPGGVFAQKFNAAGGAVGGEFRINSTTSGGQTKASLAMLDLNNFVAVWSGQSSGDGTGVLVRQYGTLSFAPVITSSGGGEVAAIEVAENTTALSTVTAIDADLPAQTLNYSIAGGADALRFGIDGSSGVLRFLTARDFETRADDGADNIYDVIVRVSDGTLTDEQAIAVTVTNVNDNPPINTVPGPQLTAKDTALVFSAAGGNAIAVADADNAGPLKITLVASGGVLTLSGTTGLTFSSGTGSGDASMVFTGSAADINAALDNLRFTPQLGFTGASSLQIGTDDQGGGGGTALTDTDLVSISVADASMWLSTKGASSSAGSGALTWDKGQVVNFGNPNLALGSGTTSGTFSAVFNANLLAADGSVDVNGLHFVSRAVTVGTTNPISLQAGDVLFTVDNNETFAGLAVGKRDLILFRPTTAGNYASGSFQVVLRNPGGTGNDIRDFVLVETAVTVGGTSLQAGDFLLVLSSGGYDKDISLFRPTTMGTDPTGGTLSLFIDGNSTGINSGSDQIWGLELVQQPLSLGGLSLAAGTLLVSLDGPASVGINGLSVLEGDIFALNVTATGAASAATATMVLRSGDVGLTGGSERFDAIALVQRASAAPVVTLGGASISYTENAAAMLVAPAATVSDADSTQFGGGSLTAYLSANGTAGDRLAIRDQGNGAGQIGVVGSDVFYGGVLIGTFSGGADGGTPLVVSLNASATVAATRALLQNISFANVSDDPSTLPRTLRVVLADGSGGISAAASLAINVVATNDPALLSADVINLTEADSAAAISTTGVLTISDVDNPATFVAQTGTAGSYGSFVIDAAGAWTYTASSAHNQFVAGTNYTDTFAVASADGTTSSVTINILGTNDAAVLGADARNLTETNAVLSSSGVLTISDADSPATFVAQTGTAGSYGSFSIDAAGAWTYTASSAHNQFVAGTTYTDTFAVASADGTTSSVTISILGTNDAPAASAASVSTAEDAVLNAIVPVANDVDGSVTSYVLASGVGAGNGSVSFNTDGSYAFNPGSDFETLAAGTSRDVSFTYTAIDNLGLASAAAMVTVTVNGSNDAPVAAAPIADQGALQGVAFTFSVPAGSFSDVDAGDTLSYAATLSSGAALPSWLAFDTATQTFSGTPGNADVGTIGVRVTATDGSNASTFGDFTLTVANVNDAPVLTAPIATQTATQDATFSFTLPAGTFTDADAGDSLSYGATLTSGAALPSWLAFDTATQTFSGTPGNADVGVLSVRVNATDASGASASADFQLTVQNVNDAPVLASPIAAPSATQDAAFSFSLPAGSFTDADVGDTLSYAATLASGAALPSWLSFDAATQTFSGNPGNSDVGVLALRVTASDTAGAIATADFNLAVIDVNDVPVQALPLPGQQALPGTLFGFTLPSGSFIDIDAGDALSYSATLTSGAPLPAWLSFDTATRTFSGAPANSDLGALAVRVTVTDNVGASTHGDFALAVSLPVAIEVAPVPSQPAVETPAAPPAPAPARPATAQAPQADVPPAAAPPSTGSGLLPAVTEAATTTITHSTVVIEQESGRSASQSDTVLAEAILPQFFGIDLASMPQLLNNDDMLRKFEEMRRQMENGADTRRTIAESGVALSAGLSIGYVVWLVRGGVLLSSVLSAMPAWQMMDPLPVLAATRKRDRHGAAEADEPEVERLFDKSTTPVVRVDRTVLHAGQTSGAAAEPKETRG